MVAKILRLKWNGAKAWRKGFVAEYATGRVKIVHESGNILLDCSEQFFYDEIGKGRIMVRKL